MMADDLADVRKRLRDNPNDPFALKSAARYYLQEGSYKQSQNLYAQSVTNSPRIKPGILLDFEAQFACEPEKIGAYLSLAGFYILTGEIDAACLELEEIVELFPKKVEPYQALGRIYIKQEKIDEAIALMENSLRQGVEEVSLREILAAAYLGKGRVEEAICFYEEVRLLKPGDKHTLRILGELYTRTERYAQAAQAYNAMFSEDPEVVREVIQRLEDLLKKVEGSIEIREILSEIYTKTMDTEAAVGKLREILRLESNKIEDIISKLRSILKNYPNLPSAVLTLAEALRTKGDYSEAVEIYYQLVKVKPEMVDQIIQGYQGVLAVCPDQVLARAYLGEALLYTGKVTEALQEFARMVESDPAVADMVIKKSREVLKTHPQLLDAHITLGRAYMAKNDYQRAVNEAEGAIAIDKRMTAAYLLLGEAYAKLKMGKKSAATIRLAMMLDPFNPNILTRYREVKERELAAEIAGSKELSLHYDLAKLYLQKGEREEAVRELQLAVKDPGRAALAYNLLGNIYRSEGRFDLAAAQYNRALEANTPELAKLLHFNIGTTHEAQGEVRKAVKIYESILQEDIDFGDLKRRVKGLKSTSLPSMRSRALQMVIAEYGKKDIIALWGREEKVDGRAAKKEEVSLSFGQEHNQSGFDYFLKGMYQAAEEEFLLAVQLDPRFGIALNNLAVALAKAGRLEEARLRLMEAVQHDPSSSVFYNNLGATYLLLGKTDLARTAFEKSAAFDPGSAAISINRGDLSFSRGEIEKAIELYRKVGAFDPLSDLAERRLLYKVPAVEA